MDAYWLTPITSLTPLTLGEDRLKLHADQADHFRRKLLLIHPRLLMFFKASLLLSEDAGSCGIDELPFELSDAHIVHFDETLPLSHCAEAFFDRIPSAREQKAILDKARHGKDWSVAENGWLGRWDDWLQRGWPVILLR